jgi:hypothetical protein
MQHGNESCCGGASGPECELVVKGQSWGGVRRLG